MILLLPPRWLLIEADQNKSEPIQQISSTQTIATPEPLTDEIHYRDVYISREILIRHLESVFEKYEIADQIPLAKQVIACESSWDINADNGVSYGIAQFTPPTWVDFGRGDIMNPFIQLEVMAKMWGVHHLQSRWDCYNMLFFK